MPDRKQAPVFHHAAEFDLQLPACSRAVLDNGVPVYYFNGGEEDVMMLDMVFGAGNAHEVSPLQAAATNFLIKNGTTTRSAFDINEHFEFYGSYLNRNCYNETSNISLHTLSKHLPELLPVLCDMLSHANFPEEEIATFIQNSKQRLAVNLMKCDFVAGREIDVLLYGFEHPYGRYTRHEDFDGLSRDQLVSFYDRHYRNGRCVIFAAGKLPGDFLEQLNAGIGRLPLTAFEQPILTPLVGYDMLPEERIHRIDNDPNGVQGAIRMARRFPNRHHPDTPGVGVLNNVFGGFFGSRLMSNIREDKGYTYGIYSYIQNHVEQSAWVISTEAGRDVCEATIAEVYKEMEILRNEPVDEEELLLVRNYMMGSLLGDLDGPFQIIGRWKNYILNGIHDDSYFRRATHTIKNISAEELRELARKYLQPEAFYELVVV